MAMPKAGVSLVVENDQQFKAALSEVNAGLRVNKQQMQLVTEQTREMDDRQAALQQRYEAAQQTLQSYRDKVQVLQQAYENSARREGEASKTTMEWRASLISAQTEVAKQESLLRDLSSGQETARKTTASLADVVNGLANALGISLPPGLQTAVDKLDGFSASGAAAVTVVGGLVGALASSTMDMSKTADDLLTLSTQTGLTTDQLQEFEYASELVDVSTDTLQGSLVKLTNNMQTAATGTGSAAEAFKTLKVKVADSLHQAVDLRTQIDNMYIRPVYAAEDGTVDQTQDWDGHTRTGMQSYGNMVRIRHADYKSKTLQTRYAHLSSYCVKYGQRVKEGEIIGYSGVTGNVFGAHLHFEVILGGKRTNPLVWLDSDFTTASGRVFTYRPGEHAVQQPEQAASGAQTAQNGTGKLQVITVGPVSQGDADAVFAVCQSRGLTDAGLYKSEWA